SALMELFNVKPAENAVAELLVRGMTPYIWAYLSPRSEPTLAPCTRKPILDIRQSSC
ncbi:transcriptional regulator, partial [Klebsiella pneumoniae]